MGLLQCWNAAKWRAQTDEKCVGLGIKRREGESWADHVALGIVSSTRAILRARTVSSTVSLCDFKTLCILSTTVLKDDAAPRSCLNRTRLKLA